MNSKYMGPTRSEPSSHPIHVLMITFFVLSTQQVFDGQDELLPLPGTTDPLNPVLYRQISGLPIFDETGERSDAGGAAAVYALTAGGYWCMLAESNGEAVLFDAPEGIMRFSDTNKALLYALYACM